MALPIEDRKNEIQQLIRNNQVLVLSSETGTGKTTQVPKYVYEMYGESVICSQPRRIAAISIAKRVSEEMGQALGQLVGYSVRFEECTSENTRIRYVTDGTLLRDFIDDPKVSQYKAIIIDEVHERTINIDLLLGLVKDAIQIREDLKVVIMSATLSTDKFLDYFPGAETLHIKSRSYPIEVVYAPSDKSEYLEKAIETSIKISENEPEGDILVFLTGEDEIEKSCRMIMERQRDLKKKLIPLPLYSSLPMHAQNEIFEKKGGRKVIFATNIAETSITIESIVYVIDCGYSKQKIYDSKMQSEMLLRLLISKSSADQRKGRAGRVRSGICYRLYDEETYKKMEPFTIPEILRGELSSLILKMARLEIKNLVTFDFIEPPLPESVIVALNQLYFLGAIDSNGNITEEGRLMVEFPLEPKDAKTLLESIRYGVEEEITTLAAISGNLIFDKKKFDLGMEHSDHLSYYLIVRDFENTQNKRQFCYAHGLNEKNLENTLKSKKQIRKILEKIRPKIAQHPGIDEIDVAVRVEMAILGGYLLQTSYSQKQRVAFLAGSGASVQIRRLEPPKARTIGGRRGSSQNTDPKWITYKELTKMDGKYVIRLVSDLTEGIAEKLFQKNAHVLAKIQFSPLSVIGNARRYR
ncbi:pre-mRNA-splicing factor ATP-dependent RNA helicase DHX15/PRP43 [Nematocida minor]|uniref:pre-mRNA-splicing factor ATP-dependent RNA helicase DHX15/PRP43 n=1 Tax=Nematocida minor TaxID=1912983 RepID=UPI00221F5609|nr:pre-mRNA-splicing factor ATP-dependent RNA helicase DHX15/PRP43 [Nematocida minor]KAI5191087.1 pre-mRNA-splicing factor ATP-dependent RNA helicase DHX15/PRP43 [Nematocida minor]